MLIPILNLPDISTMQEIEKVREETIEILDAFADKEPTERKLEECFDLLQVTINLIHMIGTEKQIENAGAEHFVKMRNRGYEFSKILLITEAGGNYER
jgi:hypothetical protein